MPDLIAVAVPCYNEEVTIAKVVGDFRKVLPDAAVHVFDNNSTDRSAALARQAGAVVHSVRRQGKGHVMQAIFEKIDTDVLIIVDGDDTYPAEDAPMLIAAMRRAQADMVVGDRLKKADQASMYQLNHFGNHFIVRTINSVFGTSFEDILSGYRIFNRRFIASVPLLTPGFETETELTLQALEEGMIVIEVPIVYRARPLDSRSKLKPFQDGLRIMLTAAMLLRDHCPLRFYGAIALGCFTVAGFFAVLRVMHYLGTATLPDTLLTGMILLFVPAGMITAGIGLTLSAVNTRLREIKQLMRRKRML